jgi:hypothetical protein
MAYYIVYPGGGGHSSLSRAKTEAKQISRETGHPAHVENQRTGKTVAVYGTSRSNRGKMAKRRTAAQIRATKRLVALNKKRAKVRTNRGRPKTKRRATAKRTNRAKRATQCNPRRSSTKGLTVAQGKRLYQLGRRAPKTAVAIKRTKKGYSILTGKAARKTK